MGADVTEKQARDARVKSLERQYAAAMKRRVPMTPDEVEAQYIRMILDSHPKRRLGYVSRLALVGMIVVFGWFFLAR